MQRDQTILELVRGNPRLNLVGEVVESASAGVDRQFMEGLAEHNVARKQSGEAELSRNGSFCRGFLFFEQLIQVFVLGVTGRQGLLVMPAREFNQRRRLGGVDHSQVVVRTAVT